MLQLELPITIYAFTASELERSSSLKGLSAPPRGDYDPNCLGRHRPKIYELVGSVGRAARDHAAPPAACNATDSSRFSALPLTPANEYSKCRLQDKGIS